MTLTAASAVSGEGQSGRNRRRFRGGMDMSSRLQQLGLVEPEVEFDKFLVVYFSLELLQTWLIDNSVSATSRSDPLKFDSGVRGE